MFYMHELLGANNMDVLPRNYTDKFKLEDRDVLFIFYSFEDDGGATVRILIYSSKFRGPFYIVTLKENLDLGKKTRVLDKLNY